MSSPGAVRDYLRLTLGQRPYEVFVAIFLDAQNRLIAADELFRGTLSQNAFEASQRNLADFMDRKAIATPPN